MPTLPGRFLGYQHPSGEIHITDSNVWQACAGGHPCAVDGRRADAAFLGQDNKSTLCSSGDVPYVFDGKFADHDGPFDGIIMDCAAANNAS